MITLTQEQKELFSYIDGLTSGTGHLVYDFRDPKQYEFAVMMADMGAVNAQKTQGRYKTLELIKENQEKNGLTESQSTDAKGWQNMFTIPELKLSSGRNITANGLATVVGGYSSMNLTLMIQSRATGNIVAHGFSNDFTNTVSNVYTQPSDSTEIDVNAYMHYQYTVGNGSEIESSPSSGVVKRKDTEYTVGDPAITSPVRTTTNPNNKNAINIGLGRAWTDQGGTSQFDYAWNEPTPTDGKNPKGRIPLVGSVTFTENISTPLEFNTNFLLDIYVVDKTGGGGVMLTPEGYDDVATAFSIDSTNPKKLNFNLAPGQSTTDPGNPIVFKHVPWGSDTLAYFYFEVDVVLEDSSLASAYIQSSDDPDPDPVDGTLNIMPIDFIWHCLSSESLVNMADGSLKAIIDIVAGDKVRINAAGDIATVEWTNLGAHKGRIYDIQTESQKKIIATDNHVFFSGEDAIPASELKICDMLKTVDGIEKVEQVSISGYDGLVCNLATVKFQNPQDGNLQIGTFIANGFVVGDINSQKIIRHRRRNDISWVKSQVPAYLHEDVDLFFVNKGH